MLEVGIYLFGKNNCCMRSDGYPLLLPRREIKQVLGGMARGDDMTWLSPWSDTMCSFSQSEKVVIDCPRCCLGQRHVNYFTFHELILDNSHC